MPRSSRTLPETIASLVAEFGASSAVTAPDYKEDWARAEYIEPLFDALGWVRLNPALLTNESTGYVREVPLAVAEEAVQAPDYGFYVDGQRVFYVEAKKPYINIARDKQPARQIRNYGWSASDDVGIVTDFEEFAVYNCRVKPMPDDATSVGLIDYFTFDLYEERWSWLLDNFSPNAIRTGSPEQLVKSYKNKKGIVPVGPAFLNDIEKWRVALASALHRDNTLDERALTAHTQALLDRIIFLRIAEARGLESPGTLEGVLATTPVYPALFKLFELADLRYNSGLFHFKVEAGRDAPDQISSGLVVDDVVLRQIIGTLTSTRTPYRFEVIGTDILGSIYERFLGKELVVKGNKVTIEHKPEFQRSGGVFYTPTWVVDHIVDRVLHPLLEGKSVNQARDLRVVDPSCGSGSFLLSAYQYLIDWYTDRYSAYKRPADRLRYLSPGADGRPRLRIEERKRILVENIFGVDIDQQAVEVAKLSLLLKVIEGETQTALQVDRLLPDLDHNIVCGNSLVGTDFYTTTELIGLTPDEATKINAFDWRTAFPKIAEREGFDAVVGNPPWLMAGYYVADSMPYFHRNYESAQGKTDLYYLFLEKALRLVKPEGRIGMIVPSKLFHTQAAKALRGLLTSGGWLEEIVDFGTTKIFAGATNYSCVLTLSKGNTGPIRIKRRELAFDRGMDFSLPRSALGAATWHLVSPDRRDLWTRIEREHQPLLEVVSRFGNGVQSGADKLLLLDSNEWASLGIESQLRVPILRGRDVRRFTAIPDRELLFPYKLVGDAYQVFDEEELEVDYPAAFSYLTANRKRLESRVWFGKDATELSGAWYGMMYLDDPSAFNGEKIVTPALAPASNFALNSGDFFVTGTAGVSSIVLREDTTLMRRYVLGLLNSELLSHYIVDHSTPYQGSYYKFSAPYLRNVPMCFPDMTLRAGRRAVEDIASLTDAITGANASSVDVLLKRLDDLVFELYRVTDDERASLST